MKKTLIVLSVIFFSCKAGDTSPKTNSKDSIPLPTFIQKRLAAAWITRDSGKRDYGWLILQISPKVTYDPVIQKHVVTMGDSICGYRYTASMVDSTGKPVLDSLGKPRQIEKDFLIKLDSVLWLSVINADSLIKVRGRF